MPEINILDHLLGTFLDTAFGKTGASLSKRQAFLDDLRIFLNDQEKHTQLDVFLFSSRPKYGSEESAEEFLPFEEIYIPLRMDQLRGTLPDFQTFRENRKSTKACAIKLLKTSTLQACWSSCTPINIFAK